MSDNNQILNSVHRIKNLTDDDLADVAYPLLIKYVKEMIEAKMKVTMLLATAKLPISNDEISSLTINEMATLHYLLRKLAIPELDDYCDSKSKSITKSLFDELTHVYEMKAKA